MIKTIVICVLFVCSVAYVKSDDDHAENAVVFNAASFDASIKREERLFVMFYAPWCGHCKRLAPTWDDLAKEFNVDGSVVTIGKVDCTVEKDLCGKHEVRGYPTLKFFGFNGDVEKYQGKRGVDDLKVFIAEQVDKPVKDAEAKDAGDDNDAKVILDVDNEAGLYDLSADNFPAHIKKGHHFIKFFAPWCGHCKSLAPAWQELATAVQQKGSAKIAKVDCTKHATVCSEHGVRGYPTLLWFTDGQMVEKYSGGRTLDSLSGYVDKMASPEKDAAKKSEEGKVPVGGAIQEGQVYDLTDATFDDHIKTGGHFVKFYAPWCGHCKSLAPTWVELGTKVQGAKISKVDCTESNAVCKKHGVSGYPTLIWFKDGEKGEEYNGMRSLEELTTFVERMSGVAAQPKTIKTEEKKPAVAPKEGVIDLTEATFDTEVAHGHTFIKFYAPWCGHCKSLAPTWQELGNSFKGTKNIRIAKVDCTQEKSLCQTHGVRGYPSLLWFTDGQNKEKYSGGRTLEALTEFVKTQTAADGFEDLGQEEEQEEDIEPEVVEIGAGEFESLVEDDYTFVMFREDKCPACDAADEVLQSLAETYNEDISLIIATLDCTSHKDVCEQEKMSSPLPAFALYRTGDQVDIYSGQSNAGDMQAFIDRKMKELGNPEHDEL